MDIERPTEGSLSPDDVVGCFTARRRSRQEKEKESVSAQENRGAPSAAPNYPFHFRPNHAAASTPHPFQQFPFPRLSLSHVQMYNDV